MATNPAVPFWDEGNTITCHAESAVTGKRFVTISGPRTDGNPTVEHTAGTSSNRALGVTARDASAGDKVSVYTAPGIVMPVTASATISAGDFVYSAADGRATPTASGNPAGIALDDAVSGADVPVKLV